MACRVFLVEDHPVMRQGYASLIAREPDMEVCGEAVSAEDAFAVIPTLSPDVVVADLSLPGVSGIELIKRLRALDACGAILVVSGLAESLYAERALSAGAQGYLMKHESAGSVVQAIRHVLAGHLYLSEALRDRLVLSRIGQSPAADSPVHALTDREIEVFEHIGRGQTTGEIADRLGLSVRAVESIRANVRRKLGVEHAAELVQQAVLWVEHSLSSVGPGAGL